MSRKVIKHGDLVVGKCYAMTTMDVIVHAVFEELDDVIPLPMGNVWNHPGPWYADDADPLEYVGKYLHKTFHSEDVDQEGRTHPHVMLQFEYLVGSEKHVRNIEGEQLGVSQFFIEVECMDRVLSHMRSARCRSRSSSSSSSMLNMRGGSKRRKRRHKTKNKRRSRRRSKRRTKKH